MIIVSLDFDSTLVNTQEYPIFDPTPLPGCLETLEWLKDNLGARFILLTQRDEYHYYSPLAGRVLYSKKPTTKSVLHEAIQWCGDNGVELIGINENPRQGIWSLSRKVYSDIIIDDRCAGIPLDSQGCVDWIELLKIFKQRYGQRQN